MSSPIPVMQKKTNPSPKCSRKRKPFFRASSSIENYVNGLESKGKPLDRSTLNFFEPRLGHNFSSVKIHNDPEATRSADLLNADAYAVGNNIVFNQNKFSPESDPGKRILAHELTHVAQQQSGAAPRKIQRLIRDSAVNCPGHFPAVADRRAAALLSNAIITLDAARTARAASPGDPAVATISHAMRTAFLLNPANNSHWDDPAPHFGLRLIRTRLEGVMNYINSVVFTINCLPDFTPHAIPPCGTDHCGGPGDNAFSCNQNPTELVLCPSFWGQPADLQAKTLMHEVLHIAFTFIGDWGQPDSANAHCYDQFVALASGFNLPPASRCH